MTKELKAVRLNKLDLEKVKVIMKKYDLSFSDAIRHCIQIATEKVANK